MPTSPLPTTTTTPSKPTQHAAQAHILSTAIQSASLTRLQTVLQEICLESPEAYNLACQKLLVSSGKRKRESTHRYEICAQCKQEYDVTQNCSDACQWHPGVMEPDMDEFFADHGPEHGPVEDYRDEMPEGFVWDCCDARGDEEGCEVNVHLPGVGKKMRM
ncbi:hypothetical protein CC86DRAFT_34829 [Ophiobolus disseminans]|uniref:Uncharacterized protein n=1 Tax=Ophiobolus disseminans TaxID=1469910 RepID=A0A6A6ZZM2_9PLEO|nr:hypothetical protein CC86DRAFT_34829 [Ophiobolus disseminans]